MRSARILVVGLLLAVALLSHRSVLAQQKGNVMGRVTDASDGSALAGVVVLVKERPRAW